MTVTIMLRSALTFGFRAVTFQRPIPRWTLTTTTSLASSAAPPVEVSPSTHGTLPLLEFGASGVALDHRLIKTLQTSMNITNPTPIQSHAIPLLLNKYDVMASSATGSGKTLMFGLPLLHRVLATSSGSSPRNNGLGQPSSLIIAPTREVSQFLLHASNFVMNVTRALTQAL